MKNSIKGFTLLEITVVVGMVAALALLTVPKFSTISESTRFGSDVRQYKALLLEARNLARNQRTCFKVVTLDPQSFQIEKMDDQCDPLGSSTFTPITLELETAALNDGTAEIKFLGDGSHTTDDVGPVFTPTDVVLDKGALQKTIRIYGAIGRVILVENTI